MGEKLQLIKGVIFGKAEDDFPSTLLFFLDKLSFQAQTHISQNHARIMKVCANHLVLVHAIIFFHKNVQTVLKLSELV